MATIGGANIEDLLQIQECNQRCFPEDNTYSARQFRYAILSWPQLQYVARDPRGRILGYVMVEIDEKDGVSCAYIRSIAVLRPFHRSGLAPKLMKATHTSMKQVYEPEFIYVIVRSNLAALNLFTDTLGYKQNELNLRHFADGEAACVMWKRLKEREPFIYDQPRHGGGFHRGEEDVGPSNPVSTSEPKAMSA